MYSFQEVTSRFEEFLRKKVNFSADPSNLYDPCRYVLENSGKRIRPALCLMSNELYGNLTEDAFYAGAAIELFHNFTLIHDDIMDNASIRRGKAAVYKKYGLANGILSGDVMNILAYQYLEKINPKHFHQIFRLYNKTAIEVCEGQQLDMDFEEAESVVTKDDYLNMITLKTSVLLGLSMQIGAILNNANEADAALLYEFGKNLGIAFQLQDDYLDAFGTMEDIGKEPGGDIRSNKKTCLYIDCRELANEEQLAVLDQLISEENQEAKVVQTVALYQKLGVDILSKELIELYSDKALHCLGQLDKSPSQLKPLQDLSNYLLYRAG